LTELAATTPPNDTIAFSNVTVVRDQEGKLTVWVGNEKMLGVGPVQLNGEAMSLAMPMSRIRLAEDVPATPVIQTANVIEFKNFRKAQLVVDNTTDGESA
jgi:hypothetical protein